MIRNLSIVVVNKKWSLVNYKINGGKKMLTTTSNYDFADSLQSKAKLNLIDMILRDCEGFMKGSQIMELNKILNKTLEEYEVFIQQNIDHDENYQEKNREILDKYIRGCVTNLLF